MAGIGMMWSLDRAHARAASSEAEIVDVFPEGVWTDEDAAIPISSKDATWGTRNAPATLVLFSDYECPYCETIEGTIKELKRHYGPDKLRVVWKNNPLKFHPNARPAAIAGETVFRLGGNAAFWKWHALAFQHTKELSPASYEAWAVAAGVDGAKFKAAFDKQEYAAKVDADLAEGTNASFRGTPASYVNGVYLDGAQSVERFVEVIDEQIAAAKAAISAGTPSSKVYSKLATENKAKLPEPPDRKEIEAKMAAEDATVWSVPIGRAPSRGNVNAPVTIIVFSDFQCPFCAQVEPTLDEIATTYGDKVRFVWKNEPLPFHQRAEPAAELALEARLERGDKGFWAAHDLLFKNQKRLMPDDLMSYAKALDLDERKVADAIESHKFRAEIMADADLAEDLDAAGTPQLFVNGHRIAGAAPIAQFRPIIDAELKRADELTAKGVKPEKLYEELMKDAKPPPPPEQRTVAMPSARVPRRGGERAKIVLAVFSDFECSFCKRAEDTINDVEQAYGDKLKIVWRHRPLPAHKQAPLAAEAAHEAFAQKGDAGFWTYHDAVFKNLGAEDALSRASLEGYAEAQGLDLKRFKKALDDGKHTAFIASEIKAGEDASIVSTPAFVVGTVEHNKLTGYYVLGVQPFTKLRHLIDRAFKDAREKIPDDRRK
jgi:protein-disulfide isomerase